MLNTSEYGQYGVFISWKGIISCFVTLEISSAVYMQAIVKHDNERDRYASAIESLTLIMCVVWFGIYYCIRGIWNERLGLTISQMIAMFLVIWGNSVFGFWSTDQRVEYKYKMLLVVTLLMAIFQPILCVFLISIFVNKVSGLVWGIAVSNLIIYVPLFIKHIIRGRVFFSRTIWKYVLGFAIPLVPHYLSSIVLNSSDRIMIQQLVGESEAGIYNLAYSISICGTLINQAILQTFSPWVYQKIKNKEFLDIPGISYTILVAIGLMNIVIVLVSPEIVRLFAPSEYYEAIWVMPPITLSVLFMFMYNLFACFEFYYEKKYYVSTATMIGAGLNIVLNYIFIHIFGYVAAGYTTLICYILFAIMHYYFMRKICKKDVDGIKVYNSKTILLISAVYLIAGFVASMTYHNNTVRYLIIAIGIIVTIVFRKKLLCWVSVIMKVKKTNEEK